MVLYRFWLTMPTGALQNGRSRLLLLVVVLTVTGVKLWPVASNTLAVACGFPLRRTWHWHLVDLAEWIMRGVSAGSVNLSTEWFQEICSLILIPSSISSQLSNTFEVFHHRHSYGPITVNKFFPFKHSWNPYTFQTKPATKQQLTRDVFWFFCCFYQKNTSPRSSSFANISPTLVDSIKKTSPRSNKTWPPTRPPTTTFSKGKTCLVWWPWYFQWLPRWAL